MSNTADRMLLKALAGIDAAEDGNRRYRDALQREAARNPHLSPEQLDIRVRDTRTGKKALRDIANGHRDAQSYGVVAQGLMLRELLERGTQAPRDGEIGGGVKRAAGAPAPRPAGVAA